MTTDAEARKKLQAAIVNAIDWLREREFALTKQDIHAAMSTLLFMDTDAWERIVKQHDIHALAAQYRVAFAGAVAAFLISHHNGQTLRDELRNTIHTFLILAFLTGYRKAGGGEPDTEDQLWIDARMATEIGFSAAFVASLMDLDTEGKSEAELRALAAAKVAGYVATLYAVYNMGLLRGARNVMLTFTGVDGMESCRTCQRLKGQRHLAKWWIERRLVPGEPGNPNFECKGYLCRHYLETDDGAQYTEFDKG